MATVTNNIGPTAPPSGAYPSDEQILGIYENPAQEETIAPMTSTRCWPARMAERFIARARRIRSASRRRNKFAPCAKRAAARN